MRVDILVYSISSESRTLANRVRQESKDFRVNVDSFAQAEEAACEQWHKVHGTNWQCITRLWSNVLVELFVTPIKSG